MKLFEMKHIKKSFDGLEVLKDISLDVEEGEVLLSDLPVPVNPHFSAVPPALRHRTAARSSKPEMWDWCSSSLICSRIFP